MDRRDALKRMGMSLVFYFTATGNSLFIAKSLSDAPISIPQELKKDKLSYEADEIGFVFPDYAASAPMIVREFLKKAKFKAGYMFSVITFGNAAVNVCQWWDRFAKENGVSFHYIKSILMVDNYLPVFEVYPCIDRLHFIYSDLHRIMDIDGVVKCNINGVALQPQRIGYNGCVMYINVGSVVYGYVGGIMYGYISGVMHRHIGGVVYHKGKVGSQCNIVINLNAARIGCISVVPVVEVVATGRCGSDDCRMRCTSGLRLYGSASNQIIFAQSSDRMLE